LQQLWIDALRAAIKGVIQISVLTHAIPDLLRHLTDSPRRRKRRTLDGLILEWIS
jgi:hypothetical protein